MADRDITAEVKELLHIEPAFTALGVARRLGISEEEATTAISSLGSDEQPKSKKKKSDD